MNTDPRDDARARLRDTARVGALLILWAVVMDLLGVWIAAMKHAHA